MTTQEIIEGLLTKKIRPEFGNPEHIKAARKFEEAHAEDAPEGGKYIVNVYVDGDADIEVEAGSEDEAIEKAKELINDGVEDLNLDYSYHAELVKEKNA